MSGDSSPVRARRLIGPRAFIRLWTLWAFCVLVGSMAYGVYRAYAGLPYPPVRILAVGFTSVLAVNLPYFLLRSRVR